MEPEIQQRFKILFWICILSLIMQVVILGFLVGSWLISVDQNNMIVWLQVQTEQILFKMGLEPSETYIWK